MSAIDPSRFADLCRRIDQELDDGNVTAAQVAVGLHGEVVAMRSFGAALFEYPHCYTGFRLTKLSISLLQYFKFHAIIFWNE